MAFGGVCGYAIHQFGALRLLPIFLILLIFATIHATARVCPALLLLLLLLFLPLLWELYWLAF